MDAIIFDELEPHAPRRLVSKLLIGAAIAVGVAVAGRALIHARRGCEAKADRAHLAVSTFAHEAYPLWATAHPGRVCPHNVRELFPYGGLRHDLDPWGHPYRLQCDLRVRPAHDTVVVISAGEDGSFHTADDVRSDR